jgi:hypothetical protein
MFLVTPASATSTGAQPKRLQGAAFLSVNPPGTRSGIQDALNKSHDAGSGVVDVYPAVYDIDSPLSIWSDTELRAAGPGVIFRKSGSWTGNMLQNHHFTGVPDSDIVVRGITFDAGFLGGAGSDCVRITNAKRVSFIECVFLHPVGEAIAVYGNHTVPGVNRDIEVRGGQVGPTGDSGLDVKDVIGMRVVSVQFRNIGQASVDLEPNEAKEQVVGFSMTGCKIAGGTSPFGVVVQGDAQTGVQGVIRGCSFTGNSIDSSVVPVFFAGSNLLGVSFVGNTITRGTQRGFWAINQHGITRGVSILGNYVAECSQAGIGSYSAMEFAACEGLTVTGNTIVDSATPRHKYGLEFNAGSAGNWYRFNSIKGATVGDIRPDIEPNLAFIARMAGVIFAGTVDLVRYAIDPAGETALTRVYFGDVVYAKGGPGPGPLALTLRGGKPAGSESFVVGQPKFEKSKRYIVLAHADLGSAKDLYLPIIGLDSGFFPVAPDSSTHVAHVYDSEYRPVVQIKGHHLVVIDKRARGGPPVPLHGKASGEPSIELLDPSVDPGTRVGEGDFLRAVRDFNK